MSIKRSKAWNKKRKQLESKEATLKAELEKTSTDFEGQVKKIATISLVSGLAVLGAYGIYRAFSQHDNSSTEQLPAPTQKASEVKKVSKPGFSWKALLLERMAVLALKVIGTQLSTFLSNKFDIDEAEEED